MKTLDAQFDDENLLLMQNVRAKINEEGNIANCGTLVAHQKFINNFEKQFLNEM